MKWKKIELNDIERIQSFIGGRFQTGDLSCVNLYMWRKAKKLEYHLEDGLLVIRGIEKGVPFIYPPVSDSEEKVLSAALSMTEKNYMIRGVPEEIHRVLKDKLPLTPERDRFDYIYLVEELISLRGRKYHKKKNHLNKFFKNYEFQYERIGGKNIEEVIRFQKSWCLDKECHLDKGLSNEEEGILEVLENYSSLPLKGGLIRIEGRVAAFAIGEEITEDTVLIHIEKGDTSYSGIYQVINKIFLEEEFSSYTYVNREEDLGSDSLRKAKESYHPKLLLEKYRSVS